MSCGDKLGKGDFCIAVEGPHDAAALAKSLRQFADYLDLYTPQVDAERPNHVQTVFTDGGQVRYLRRWP